MPGLKEVGELVAMFSKKPSDTHTKGCQNFAKQEVVKTCNGVCISEFIIHCHFEWQDLWSEGLVNK